MVFFPTISAGYLNDATQSWSCICPFTFRVTTKHHYHYNWKTFLLNTAQGWGGDFPIPVRDITLHLLPCRSCTSVDFHSSNLALEKRSMETCFCQNKWERKKKERKELDAVLNIYRQRGSYVKASICKLHGRFLCAHFYLLAVCGDFVLSFTVFRAWLSLD